MLSVVLKCNDCTTLHCLRQTRATRSTKWGPRFRERDRCVDELVKALSQMLLKGEKQRHWVQKNGWDWGGDIRA
jgi:hypothetical protein